ncbi:hypothetical protein AeRB84_004807 [Aphanomyces euteiches]|nr:hypothetical protein AeRB84_004807 [Aphanomyces euteiches]
MRRKVIQDLEWALASPHLLSARFSVLPARISDGVVALDETQEWLNALNQDPSHLYEFLAEKRRETASLALGVYFASLVEYWLVFCPSWKVENLVVGQQLVEFKTERTVGQLKFVFRLSLPRDAPPVDMHWEASIKFFLLCSQDASKLEHYVGPHLGENLAWRAQEVQRKLDMCRLNVVQSWMSSHFSWTEGSGSVQSHMLLRGYLFYPLAHNVSTRLEGVKFPEDIETSHLRGWWTIDHETDLTQKSLPHSLWAILPKIHWMSSIVAVKDNNDCVTIAGDSALNLEEIVAINRNALFAICKEHFGLNKTAMPLLVAELHYSPEKSHWREVSRGFIMNGGSWNPTPLTHDALRYRRNRSKNRIDRDQEEPVVDVPFQEREYEQRRQLDPSSIRMKQDEEEEIEKKPSLEFEESITPSELVTSIKMHLAMKKIPFGEIKNATNSILSKKSVNFVCQSVVAVVNNTDEEMDDSKKAILRVGHVILDAWIAHHENTDEEFTSLERSLKCSIQEKPRWWAVRFLLKAISTICPVQAASLQFREPSFDMKYVSMILEERSTRWNATAVDICQNYGLPRGEDEAQRVLQSLISSQDFISAEAFVVAQLKSFEEERVSLAHIFIHDPKTPAKASRRMAKLAEPYSTATSITGDTSTVLQPIEDLVDQQRRLLEITCLDLSSVSVVDTKEGVDELLSFVQSLSPLRRNIVGMDCEWRPTSFSQQDSRQVEVLQLAFSGGVVFVLDCAALADECMEKVLHSVMNAKNIILSGFSVAGDVQRLRVAYPSLEGITNCVEVRRAATARVGNAVQTWGLAALASTYLGMEVSKDQQVSDWSHRPLSSEQVAYAAMDAHCARLLLIFFVVDPVESVESLGNDTQHIWTPWLMRERNLSSFLLESDVAAAVEELGLSGSFHSIEHRGAVVKTVALVSHDSNSLHYFAVVVALSKTIDMERLCNVVGCSRLVLASDADLLHVFGYSRGCIGPIGLRQQSRVRVVLDGCLVDEPSIQCGAGALGRVVSLNPGELLGLSSVLSISSHCVCTD